MGLAAFNRMRREKAKHEAEKQPEQIIVKSKSPNDDLTVPQIKEKLEALNIEFNTKAKKDELLVLLDAAEVKQEKPQDDSDQQPE